MVMRHARRILLIIAVSDLGMRLLNDARRRPFFASRPRTVRGFFAEIPDIRSLILSIIVLSVFYDLMGLWVRNNITDDGTGYTVDSLGLFRDRDCVNLFKHVCRQVGLVQEGRTWLERKIRIVDRLVLFEVRRVEHWLTSTCHDSLLFAASGLTRAMARVGCYSVGPNSQRLRQTRASAWGRSRLRQILN